MDTDNAEVIECTYDEYGKFHNLWRKVALELRKLENVSIANIERASDALKKPFRKGENCSDFANIDFDDIANCCAYLMNITTCHTSLVKFATEQILDRVPVCVLDDMKSRSTLSIASLGGGPGNDAIGFCNALAHRLSSACRINVCTLDMWEQWKIVQKEMVETIAIGAVGSHQDFFGDLEVVFEFQRLDLVSAACGGERAPVDSIRTADVILCVKLISILKDEDKWKILQMVLSCMKQGSLFLFVDTQAKFLSYWARKERNLRILVEPGAKRFYKLNCSCGDCIEKSSFQLCAVYKTNDS